MANHPVAILFVCIFFLAGLGGTGFYFYKSWFDVDGLRQIFRKHYEQVPSWVPWGAFARSMLSRKDSVLVWEMRIISTLGLVVFIILALVILIAVASGIPVKIYFD